MNIFSALTHRFLASLLLAVFLLLAACFWSSNAVGQTNRFSGQILMPLGVVPVSSSAVFRVQTVPLQTIVLPDGQMAESSTIVTIPQLGSATSYSFPVEDVDLSRPLQERQLKIKFDCLSGCANIALTSTGFLGGEQGIVSEQDASVADSLLSQQIDIQLERADLFTGVIEFPSAILASGAETIEVTIVGSQFVDPVTFTQTIRVTEGESRWGFFIGVPATETGGGWTLKLRCENCPDELVSGPFFPTTSLGNPLTLDTDTQFFFRKTSAYSNIRLTFVAKPNNLIMPAIISTLLDE